LVGNRLVELTLLDYLKTDEHHVMLIESVLLMNYFLIAFASLALLSGPPLPGTQVQLSFEDTAGVGTVDAALVEGDVGD
jgi:membrane protein DedA with SNARE-associated domain